MSTRPVQSVGDATLETSGNNNKSSGGVTVNAPHSNQQDPARKTKHFEKVKVQQLTRQLVLRLQYAQLKVKHGWTRQTLNEVENLYFHHYRSNDASTSTSVPGRPLLSRPLPMSSWRTTGTDAPANSSASMSSNLNLTSSLHGRNPPITVSKPSDNQTTFNPSSHTSQPSPSTPGPSTARQLVPIAPAPPRPSSSPGANLPTGSSSPSKRSPSGASSSVGPIRTSPNSSSSRAKPYQTPLLGVGYLTPAALLSPTSPSKHLTPNSSRSPSKTSLKTKTLKSVSTPSTLKAPPTTNDPPMPTFRVSNNQSTPSYESFWSSMRTSSLGGGNGNNISLPPNGPSNHSQRAGGRKGSMSHNSPSMAANQYTGSTASSSNLSPLMEYGSPGGLTGATSNPVVASNVTTSLNLPGAGPGLNFYMPQSAAGSTEGSNIGGGYSNSPGPGLNGQSLELTNGLYDPITTPNGVSTTPSTSNQAAVFLPMTSSASASTPPPTSVNTYPTLPPNSFHLPPSALTNPPFTSSPHSNPFSVPNHAHSRTFAFDTTPEPTTMPFATGHDFTSPTSSFNPSNLSLPPNFTAAGAALGSPTRNRGASAGKRDTRIAG